MCAGEGCSVFGPCFYYSVLSILFSFAVILRERERERDGRLFYFNCHSDVLSLSVFHGS